MQRLEHRQRLATHRAHKSNGKAAICHNQQCQTENVISWNSEEHTLAILNIVRNTRTTPAHQNYPTAGISRRSHIRQSPAGLQPIQCHP